MIPVTLAFFDRRGLWRLNTDKSCFQSDRLLVPSSRLEKPDADSQSRRDLPDAFHQH
jgi:hypothetical protein